MIMTLVPLVGAAATHYSHFDMIHYGSYVSALSPLWMALFTTGDNLTHPMTLVILVHGSCWQTCVVTETVEFKLLEPADMQVSVLSSVDSPDKNPAVCQVLCIFKKLHAQ